MCGGEGDGACVVDAVVEVKRRLWGSKRGSARVAQRGQASGCMDCVVDLEKHMTVESLHSPSSLQINQVKDHRNSFVSSSDAVLNIYLWHEAFSM